MSVSVSSVVRGVLVPAVVALVSSLSKRKMRVRPGSVSADEAIDAAGSNTYFQIATLLSAISISGSSFLALKGLSHLIASIGPAPERVLKPDWITWFFFPFFGGIILCYEFTLQLWSLKDRCRAEAYSAWSNEKVGFDCRRLLRWMAFVITLPLGIFQFLLLPVQDRFYNDEVAIGRVARITPEKHRYDSVRDFETYMGFRNRDGSFSRQPSIYLRFADGKEWTSWSTREDMKLDDSLVNYLSIKIGRPPRVLSAKN